MVQLVKKYHLQGFLALTDKEITDYFGNAVIENQHYYVKIAV